MDIPPVAPRLLHRRLTAEQREAIVTAFNHGTPQGELAARYGISVRSVRRLVRALLAAARPLMLRWAARLVEDPATVEDVVQDALMEAHRTLASLREPAAVAGWLHLAVRKHADRHRRRQRPRLLLDMDLRESPDPAAPRPEDPALAAERAEDRVMIRRALTLATDADRLLLVLRYYGGWAESDYRHAQPMGEAHDRCTHPARGHVRPRRPDALAAAGPPTAVRCDRRGVGGMCRDAHAGHGTGAFAGADQTVEKAGSGAISDDFVEGEEHRRPTVGQPGGEPPRPLGRFDLASRRGTDGGMGGGLWRYCTLMRNQTPR